MFLLSLQVRTSDTFFYCSASCRWPEVRFPHFYKTSRNYFYRTETLFYIITPDANWTFQLIKYVSPLVPQAGLQLQGGLDSSAEPPDWELQTPPGGPQIHQSSGTTAAQAAVTFLVQVFLILNVTKGNFKHSADPRPPFLGTSSSKRCEDETGGGHDPQKQVGSPDDTCGHGREAVLGRVSLCSLQRKWWVGRCGSLRRTCMDEWAAPPLDKPFSHPLRLRSPFVVENLLKYTGYGNAAGLLVARGLLAGGRGETQYSEDEDSDTEEYKSAKPLCVTLCLPALIAPRVTIDACIEVQLSDFFQYQPHHRPRGGAHAQPRGGDDGGAEGVWGRETRHDDWQVV